MTEGFFGWIIEQARLFFEWLGGGLNALFGLIRDFWNGLVAIFQVGLQVLADIVLWLWNALGTFLGWLVALAGAIWEFLVWVVENIIALAQLVGLVLQLIIGLFGVLAAWVAQLFNVIGSIFSGLQSAPPMPVPGLPQCVSAPLQHDLCAIWYILGNTLFSETTLGAFVINIIILMIDLWIVFYVVNKGIELIELGKEAISNVSAS